MENFKVIKCHSCGSSVVELNDVNIVKCSHCGSLLKKTSNLDNNKLLNTMYVAIALLIIIGVSMFWINAQNTQQVDKPQVVKNTLIELPTYNVPITSIPKLDQSIAVITNEEVKAYQSKIKNPQLEITHKEKGELRNGGLFWIVTVQNKNLHTVYNPGLIVSLFDEQEKRIDELRVWSKQKILEPGKEAVVLVNLTKPPAVKFHTQITGVAKSKLLYILANEKIEVKDYLVRKTNDKWVEIIGDVYNPNDFQADYVEIIAIAKDSSGKSIGIGWTFASISNMPAKSTSGFKIKAGTFLIKEASSWSLSANGRKHKK